MNPKEKAKELVNKFLRIEDDTQFYWEAYNDVPYTDDEVLPHAKRCALFVVSEIKFELSHGLQVDWVNERQGGEEFILFWNSVEKEINAL